MAGDHANDVAAANGAGVPCVVSAAWELWSTGDWLCVLAAVAQTFADPAPPTSPTG